MVNPMVDFSLNGSPSDYMSGIGLWADAFFQTFLPVIEVLLGISIACLMIVLLIKLFAWVMASLHHSVAGSGSGSASQAISHYRPIYKDGREAGFERI
jgi:hypothetical protein